MDPPDDDFEFDFFEEPQPEPAHGLRARLPQRARPAGDGPQRPLAPLLRLTTLVFFVVFLLLVFSLLVASCAGESRQGADSAYMNAVNTIAQQSTSNGAKTVSILTTPGLHVSQMVTKLQAIAAAEQQNVDAAKGLSPPGRLRPANAAVVEALQLRVLGINGLASAFQQGAASKSSSKAEATALSQQAYRLLASDVIWNDLFQKPSVAMLSREGVAGINVPGSVFLANPNVIVTPRAMSLVVNRIAAASSATKGSCSGVHGTNLVSVEALPSGSSGSPQVLKPGKLNTVTTSSSLIFRVTIHNGGNFQEVQIPVQLTVGRPANEGGPITRTSTVQLINPGNNQAVTFGGLGQVPFASQTTVNVNVARVCGETDISNNHAQYNVIFSLPA